MTDHYSNMVNYIIFNSVSIIINIVMPKEPSILIFYPIEKQNSNRNCYNRHLKCFSTSIQKIRIRIFLTTFFLQTEQVNLSRTINLCHSYLNQECSSRRSKRPRRCNVFLESYSIVYVELSQIRLCYTYSWVNVPRNEKISYEKF